MSDGIFPHTVTIESVSARDAYGAQSYTAIATPRAHVVPTPRVLKRANGEEITSTARVICEGPISGLTEDAVVTLPSAFSTLGFSGKLRILQATPYVDPETGDVDNVELYV